MLLNRINQKITWAILCGTLLASCGQSAAIENFISADPQLKNQLNYQSTKTEPEINQGKVNSEIAQSNTNISQSQSDSVVKDKATTETKPLLEPPVTLPEDFPQFLPRYPQAKLEKVKPGLTTTEGSTLWRSPDPIDSLISYYQEELQSDDWQIIQPFTPNQNQTQLKAIAVKENLQVGIAIAETLNEDSKFTLSYQPVPQDVADSQADSNTNLAQSSNKNEASEPINSNRTITTTQDNSSPSKTLSQGSAAKNFVDFDEVPEQLREYVKEVAELGILTPYTQNGNPDSNSFAPNEPISRGEYARWLIAANNLYYSDSPGNKILVPNQSELPAFKDISPKEPGFGAIQGLAEAGLIPSMLTDDSSKLLFQPNAPLKREDLIAWKVPLDLRKALPPASAQAIEDSWGFQDVANIDPAVFKALFGDFQNGDRSNIKRIFGYTTLFQPKKPVTRAEAAASLWYFGFQGDGITAPEALSLKNQSYQTNQPLD